jgi:hypothetical protein
MLRSRAGYTRDSRNSTGKAAWEVEEEGVAAAAATEEAVPEVAAQEAVAQEVVAQEVVAQEVVAQVAAVPEEEEAAEADEHPLWVPISVDELEL